MPALHPGIKNRNLKLSLLDSIRQYAGGSGWEWIQEDPETHVMIGNISWDQKHWLPNYKGAKNYKYKYWVIVRFERMYASARGRIYFRVEIRSLVDNDKPFFLCNDADLILDNILEMFNINHTLAVYDWGNGLKPISRNNAIAQDTGMVMTIQIVKKGGKLSWEDEVVPVKEEDGITGYDLKYYIIPGQVDRNGDVQPGGWIT